MNRRYALPLTAALGGAAAWVLRLLQNHTGYEAGTGLPIPGNPAALALAVLLAGLAVLPILTALAGLASLSVCSILTITYLLIIQILLVHVQPAFYSDFIFSARARLPGRVQHSRKHLWTTANTRHQKTQ